MNKKNFAFFSLIIENTIKYFKWMVLFSLFLILLSGVYRVESNETAIVLRFGRLTGNTLSEQVRQPGLHFALPFFIDEVIKIPVQTMHEIDIMTHYIVWGNRILPDVDMNGYLLTGDNNVVLLRAAVLYQINNPVQYIIYNRNTSEHINGIVSGELTKMVTQMDIDSVLTHGRSELSYNVLINSQKILDELQTGVHITAIELIGIVPPMETLYYFDEVRSAAIYRETLIQSAYESASTLVLNAEAESNSHVQNAVIEQFMALSRVHAEMAEFNGLLPVFAINPDLVIRGILSERLGAIYSQSGGTIIIPDVEETPLIMLP